VLLVGGRLGVGAIIAICGWCIVAVDTWRHLLPAPLESMSTWRLSLMALALPGLVLVPLILTLPRPSGGQGSALTARQAAPPVWPFLRGQKMAMASFYLGIGLQSMAIGCVLNFAPVVAMRLMQASPAQAGNGMGAATFTATVMGFLIAQGANGRMTSRWGQRLPPLVMITAVACSFVPLVGILFSNTHTTLFIGSGAFLTLVMAGTLLYPTALQDMTPAPMRARLAAISVTVNIVGAASGPAFVGALSDGLKARSDGLLLSMVSVALVAVVLSFLLLLPLPSRYLATVTAARQTEAQFSPGQTVA
jgi:MFS family permease